MGNDAVGTNYKITLFTEGIMDQMHVDVETKKIMPEAEREALAKVLQVGIKAVITLTPSMAVLDPGSIEQTTIKAKRVEDNRKK